MRSRLEPGLDVSRWRACAAALVAVAALATAQAGSLTVSVQTPEGTPLADAAVFLESPEARAAVRPGAKAEIAQVDRRFVPEVSVLPVGAEVRFPNRDKVRHHVYSFSPAKSFELKLYSGTPANPVTFDRPGIVVLGCNIHDRMTAWVVVVETPYFGRTDARGQVTLAEVPAGSYRLRTWHPGLAVGAPALEQPVQITAAAATLRVTLPGVRP